MMRALILTGYATEPFPIKGFAIDTTTGMIKLFVECGEKIVHCSRVVIYTEEGGDNQ
jgi:hypothetical protein